MRRRAGTRTLDIEPVPDTAAAQRFVDTLDPTPLTVASLVPGGYEAYARILHPAWRVRHTARGLQRSPVRWSEVATIRGTVEHRLMQWPGVWGMPRFGPEAIHLLAEAGLAPIEAPDDGRLPAIAARRLRAVLGTHARPTAKCRFAVWTGWGREYKAGVPENTGRIHTGAGEWDLFRAPLKRLGFGFLKSPAGLHFPAGIVWPPDRSWFMATDAEVESTYVGGPEKLIMRLLEDRHLEAWEAYPQDGCWDDPVNPIEFALNHRFGVICEHEAEPEPLRARITGALSRLAGRWRATPR